MLDPVSNRRPIFLLALTAGICFAVFVGISLKFAVPPAHDENSTCTIPQHTVLSAIFDAGRLALLNLEGKIVSVVFVEISWTNTTAMLIPTGCSFSMFLIQSVVTSLSIWLLGFSNCRLWLGNRFQSPSASSASITTHHSAGKLGFNVNFSDGDLFFAGLLTSGTRFLLLGTSTSASNRCGIGRQGDNKTDSMTSSCPSNYNETDFSQPAPLSTVRASKSSPILDDVSSTINTGSSHSTTTSEEAQSPSE